MYQYYNLVKAHKNLKKDRACRLLSLLSLFLFFFSLITQLPLQHGVWYILPILACSIVFFLILSRVYQTEWKEYAADLDLMKKCFRCGSKPTIEYAHSEKSEQVGTETTTYFMIDAYHYGEKPGYSIKTIIYYSDINTIKCSDCGYQLILTASWNTGHHGTKKTFALEIKLLNDKIELAQVESLPKIKTLRGVFEKRNSSY